MRTTVQAGADNILLAPEAEPGPDPCADLRHERKGIPDAGSHIGIHIGQGMDRGVGITQRGIIGRLAGSAHGHHGLAQVPRSAGDDGGRLSAQGLVVEPPLPRDDHIGRCRELVESCEVEQQVGAGNDLGTQVGTGREAETTGGSGPWSL